jgi:hypothetical protein
MAKRTVEQLKAAKGCSVPLVAVNTPDQWATLTALSEGLNGTPQIVWDLCRGLRALNRPGSQFLTALEQRGTMPSLLQNPGELLNVVMDSPAGLVVFVINAHKLLGEPMVVQALMNLRDEFKSNSRMVVMLGPSFSIPPELDPDVIVLDEPYPTREELEEVMRAQYRNVKLAAPGASVLARCVDGLLGLAEFTAENIVAMAMGPSGVSLAQVWDRKFQKIDATDGLSIFRGEVTFKDVGGNDVLKDYWARFMTGPDAPKGLVFSDEIEKAMAGAGTESTGTTTRQLGYVLADMENKKSQGQIFHGFPGTSKTLMAMAIAGEFGIPLLMCDLGGAMDSFVGNTEAKTRNMLKVIDSVCQGRAFYLATCNDSRALKPELKRRYTAGEWFFDIPTRAEADKIWPIQLKAFGVDPKQERPDYTNWTGAEIRNCCRNARALNCSLLDAARYVVPFFRANAERIEAMRRQAHGVFLNPQKPGPYQHPEIERATEQVTAKVPKRGREIKFQ